MNIEILKYEIERFDIVNRTIRLFWETLYKYKKENFDEYKNYFLNDDPDKFKIVVSSISLKLGNWPECNYNHLVAFIPIWYDELHIGDYLVMFSLDGEVDDDMFNIFSIN